MKKTFVIVGCGFLGGIVAAAWKQGFLPDYEPVGVLSRTRSSAEKLADILCCPVLDSTDALIALNPNYVVETASVETVRSMAIPVLSSGSDLIVLSIGAFADSAFYEQVVQTARLHHTRIHLPCGAVGGFDVLQTVSLMAQASSLPQSAGITTHTGAKGFINTPVFHEHLLTDTEKTQVFSGNAYEAIQTFPRRVNVAVATSLATLGSQNTNVSMYSVPGWTGDDHCLRTEIDGVRAVIDIESSTSAIAGWSVVALMRNLTSPISFY